jgi:hypothetical protein
MNRVAAAASVMLITHQLFFTTSLPNEKREASRYAGDISALIEYINSAHIGSKGYQNSGCLRSRRYELGDTWCVNCHAGMDPDRMRN